MNENKIEHFKKCLNNWKSISTLEELSERWKKCKYWIIDNADDFEERKTMDLLCNDYYQFILKRIENT